MSAAMAAAAAAAATSALQNRNYSKTRRASSNNTDSTTNYRFLYAKSATCLYDDAQRQRDWNSFDQFRKTYYSSPISLARCSVEHVVQFLQYVDKLGKLTLESGNFDAMMNRLRVSFEENGGRPEKNPFSSVAVRSYLRQMNQQS